MWLLSIWVAELPSTDYTPGLAVKIVAGFIGTIGLGLLLFKKIYLTPWFVIDLGSEKPKLNLGPPGLRFTVASEKMKNCIQIPDREIFLYMSFLTRLLIKISLGVWLYESVNGRLTYRYAVATGVGLFVVLTIIEQGVFARFAPAEDDAESDGAQAEDPSPAV